MNHLRLLPLAAALAALGACHPKTPGSADSSAPVATVNGTSISRDFYEFYIKGITGGKSSAELTAQQRDLALDNLIRARVVGDQAAREGLDKHSDTAVLLELSRLNVLQQAVMDGYLKDRKASEQELRAEYETQLAGMPKLEYHARHILVATEPFAHKLIARLEKGEKFEDLARTESMDSSKSTGGDLGWFTADRMVPEFSGAVSALKAGDYTHNPVQTQYGWHVIQLLETRELKPPPFEQVRQRLEQMVENKKFRTYTDELMRNAKIEKLLDKPAAAAAPGAAGAPGVPAATPPPATPAPATPAPGRN